jgi:endonuclease/exonuclease/phosphatase family metal-dependent hydrolase
MQILKLLTWNLAFASRKKSFILDDNKRAEAIAKTVSTLSPDIVALQEVASRVYSDGTSFDLSSYLTQQIPQYKIFFQPALSLPIQHSNPYGKAQLLQREFGISSHQQGVGLLYSTNSSNCELINLYSDNMGEAKIETTHPLPQPLYMGSAIDESSAGRDDEDRPALWSRWEVKEFDTLKLFFVSLHMPTLKGERGDKQNYTFTQRQIEIRDEVLNRPDILTIDELGVEFRCYYLRGIVSQCRRLESYWRAKESETKVLFVLAGDFNFDHVVDTKEKRVLESSGFIMSQTVGATKNSGMLIDNIWIRSDIEIKIKGEILSDSGLNRLSDHFPLVVELMFYV